MLATLRDFARMLGLSEENAGEALHSERAARVTLTRRNLFAAAGALASGAAFGFGVSDPLRDWLPEPDALPFFGVDRSPLLTWERYLAADRMLRAGLVSLETACRIVGPLPS